MINYTQCVDFWHILGMRNAGKPFIKDILFLKWWIIKKNLSIACWKMMICVFNLSNVSFVTHIFKLFNYDLIKANVHEYIKISWKLTR